MLTVYLVPLSWTQHTLKASAYYTDPQTNELRVLWLNDCVGSDNFDKLARSHGFAINNSDRSKPKLYFKSSGYGFDKMNDIGEQVRRTLGLVGLAKPDERVQFYTLEGFAPSSLGIFTA